MKYRELKEALSKMSEEQLDMSVAVRNEYINEYFPVEEMFTTNEEDCNVLDNGHPVLNVLYTFEGQEE